MLQTKGEQMSKIQVVELHDWKDPESLEYKAPPGLTEETVRMISTHKKEPPWMLEKRLRALKMYHELKMPAWGPALEKLELEKITYFQVPKSKQNAKSWEELPDDIKKTFEKLGIPEAEKKSLSGAGAQYECLSEDSTVWTASRGPAKIKDIQQGDFVFALDEKSKSIKKAKILDVKYSGKKLVYEVSLGTRSIKASENHPFLVLVDKRKKGRIRARYTKEWKQLKELKKGDLIAIATAIPHEGNPFMFQQPNIQTHSSSTNQFGVSHTFRINYTNIKLPKISTEDTLWFLGVLLGDGYIKHEKGREKARVNIAIPKEQEQLRSEIKKVVHDTFEINTISEYKQYIAINSSILAKFIEQNGISGNAHTKSIPQWIHTLPTEQKLAFLGGYLDTDGYVTNNGTVSFTSTNKKILEDVRILASYCSLNSSNVHTFKSKHPHDKNRYIIGHRVSITGNLEILKSRYLFKKKRLAMAPKKYRSYTSGRGTTFKTHCSHYMGFAKIQSITKKSIVPVYDIEVEGHHNFIAEGIILHNSVILYHNIKKELEDKGVIFEDMDIALQKYPELVQKYFMTCVPITLHKFTALHGAVWSGGTFIYVPKGVKVDMPLQAYFRMNAERGGQFEHTLIIVEEEAEVAYIEGCSAPQYSTSSLHAGCVEVIVKKKARARYSSVESWSKNTYNLNTKRATVEEDGIMEWIGGNLGSAVTMLYPCTILKGDRSRTEHIAIAFAGKGQNQDTGAKIYHIGKNTSSHVTSKSISIDGGITSYRGIIHSTKSARNVKSAVECDALMIDNKSQSNTYPVVKVENDTTHIAHEATVGRISPEKIFYLTSRGITEEEAKKLVVSGFIEPVTKQLPMEYAVELNKLIELEMEGSLG